MVTAVRTAASSQNKVITVMDGGLPVATPQAGRRGALARQRPSRQGGLLLFAGRHDAEHHRHQQQHRAEPQQIRQRFDRRTVQDEIAIALHEIVLHVGLGGAGTQFFANLAAQVDGQVGVGIGEGLVLADEAAQLLRQRMDAGVEIGVRRCGTGGRLQHERSDAREKERSQSFMHDHLPAPVAAEAARSCVPWTRPSRGRPADSALRQRGR